MKHNRTPYQMGYEDAQDRGYGATAGVRPEEWPDYVRGYRDGEKQLADNPKTLITNLRTRLEEAVMLAGAATAANAESQRLLAAAEKARDEQAEAVRVLGTCVAHHYPEGLGWGYADEDLRRHLRSDNPTAAAAVKEASR